VSPKIVVHFLTQRGLLANIPVVDLESKESQDQVFAQQPFCPTVLAIQLRSNGTLSFCLVTKRPSFLIPAWPDTIFRINTRTNALSDVTTPAPVPRPTQNKTYLYIGYPPPLSTPCFPSNRPIDRRPFLSIWPGSRVNQQTFHSLKL